MGDRNAAFLEALKEFINSSGTWLEKKEALEAYAQVNGYHTELTEFLGWWDVDLEAPGAGASK